MDDLTKCREEIDQLDRQLVELLAKRFKITDQLGAYKREHGLEPADPGREASVIRDVSRLAVESGMDPGLMQELFPIILRYSRQSQNSNQNQT